MEESTTWKGHGLTLLVFAGIVVLCSIFFVLGMLVGRSQGQKVAETATVISSDKPAAGELTRPAPEKTREPGIDDTVDLRKLQLEPLVRPETPKKVVPAPAKAAAPPAPKPLPPPPAAGSVTTFQIAAVRRSTEADKLLAEVKGKGFPAFILGPPPLDKDPWFRIQVGPYTSAAEADMAKRKLEAAGYKTIKR